MRSFLFPLIGFLGKGVREFWFVVISGFTSAALCPSFANSRGQGWASINRRLANQFVSNAISFETLANHSGAPE